MTRFLSGLHCYTLQSLTSVRRTRTAAITNASTRWAAFSANVALDTNYTLTDDSAKVCCKTTKTFAKLFQKCFLLYFACNHVLNICKNVANHFC